MQSDSVQDPSWIRDFFRTVHCGHTNVRSRYRESSTSLRWICDCYRGFHHSRIDPRAGGLPKIFVQAAAHLLLGHRTIPVRRTRLTRDPDKRCTKGAKGPAGLAKVRVVRATDHRARLFGRRFAGWDVEPLPCPSVLSEHVTDASDPFRASDPLRPPHVSALTVCVPVWHTDKSQVRVSHCWLRVHTNRGSRVASFPWAAAWLIEARTIITTARLSGTGSHVPIRSPCRFPSGFQQCTKWRNASCLCTGRRKPTLSLTRIFPA